MHCFNLLNKVKMALLLGALYSLTLASPWFLSLPAHATSNQIQAENSLPGAANWSALNNFSNALPNDSNSHALEGYSSKASYFPGETVDFHVSASNVTRYRVELYRLGWYDGAGARQIACLPSCNTDKSGLAQIIPSPSPDTGYLNANWAITDSYTFSQQAVSGYYIAKLLITNGSLAGKSANIPIVLKSPISLNSPILIQAPSNTWQAYNPWGGKSLYDFNSTNQQQAYRVSFERPYAISRTMFFGGDSNSGYELALVNLLEKEGYDVSYTTDIDTHNNPAELLNHKLIISNGHDEYFSKQMFDGFLAARDSGVNLAFIGGNMVYTQNRHEDNGKTMVLYRNATLDPNTDPAQETVNFEDLVPSRPQCLLTGLQYFDGIIRSGDPVRNYTVNSAALSDQWFNNTGFAPGATITSANGSVGYEWDSLSPSCSPPNLTVFFHYGTAPLGDSQTADFIRYQATSGARVLSTGSLAVVNSLASDVRLQQFFRNALNDLSLSTPNPPPPPPAAPLNLAPNPDFEANPSLSYYYHTNGSASFTWTTDQAHSGTHSLKTIATSGSLSRWMSNTYAIAVTPGKTYTVSAWLKTANNSGLVSGSFWGNGGYTGATYNTGSVGANQNWTQVSMQVVAPAGSTAMRVEFRLPGTGTLWADDVAVSDGSVPIPPPDAPNNSSLPVISGATQIGQTLSATSGTWANNPTAYAYQWQSCDSAGGNCSNISGTALQAYILQSNDVGRTIKVQVTASNSGGSALAISAQTAVVTAIAPVNTSLPTISGVAQTGQRLTATTGSWNANPAPSFAYQWQSCVSGVCTDIPEATSSTYLIVTADIGKNLRVEVRATNVGGSASAFSQSTSTVTDSLSISNLAPNPNIELSPSSSYYYHTNGAATFSWATDQAYSDTHSLKTVATSGSLSRWMSNTYAIAVTPGKTYTVSAWLKTGNNPGYLAASFWSNGTYSGATYSSASLASNQNWTKLTLNPTAPAGTTSVRVEFRLPGTGTLWADDVSVTTP